MDINNASAIYFSPTESTKKTTLQVLSAFDTPKDEIDLTSFKSKLNKTSFAYDEIVIFGAAVHGGRVPAPFLEKLEEISGRNTPAVLVVTYGNRDYEDILLEMKDFIEKRGFIVIGAAAIIAQHSIIRSVAAERPDINDIVEINGFINKLLFKVNQFDDVIDMDVEVPGNFPYRIFSGVPLKPKANRMCDKCGKCVDLCPVNAINPQNPSKTDKKICISCMRCIKYCPNSARKLNRFALGGIEKTFVVKYSNPKDPEFFL
ncbi:MAG: 4Fe-4S binding protein [Clostridia bacterium]